MNMRALLDLCLVETLESKIDLTAASEDDLKKIASEFDSPEGGTWSYEPAFSLYDHIHDYGERAAWFSGLLEDDDDPEGLAHIQGLMEAPAFDPIVLWLTAEGDVYIWDGNHRLGAACLRGESTIPAIVGIAD
jgi:hypothetical protein